jgi:hypothetical protein
VGEGIDQPHQKIGCCTTTTSETERSINITIIEKLTCTKHTYSQNYFKPSRLTIYTKSYDHDVSCKADHKVEKVLNSIKLYASEFRTAQCEKLVRVTN